MQSRAEQSPSKKIGIMQPYLFPYIGYFQTIKAVDDYVIYDDVQYIKGGWINRNNILVGGQEVLFTISLVDASPNKLINEIEIKHDFRKFLKTVGMAYSRAPYKEQVLGLLEQICEYPDKNLARFTGNSIERIAGYLGLKTNIIFSSDLKKDNSLRAEEKVMAICHELGGSVYINAIGGQELYDKEQFKTNGIDLRFLKTGDVSYKQTAGDFVPYLSIIDVLMFNSPEEANELLDQYELI